MSERDRVSSPLIRQVVVMAVVFAIGVRVLWLFIGSFDDQVIQPGGVTPEASAVATPEQPPPVATPSIAPATPETAPEWSPGSLPAMLQLAPDRLADGSLPLYDVARYADIAGWMTSRGIAIPGSRDDPGFDAWTSHLAAIALPDTLRDHGLDPEWEQAYGFSLLDAGQVLSVGQAPDFVTIVRGTFDREAMQAAWVASGYQPIEQDGVTFWSLFPGETIDLSAPASRPAMGSLNNIALLEDGTLVAASRTSRMADTLAAIRGDGPSLAGNEAVSPLLAPDRGIEGLVSAVIVQGALLHGGPAPVDGALATPADPSPGATPRSLAMPPVRLMLVGIPAGSAGALALATPPGQATPAAVGSQVVVLLVTEDAGAAAEGQRWIDWSLANQVSPVTGAVYAERYGSPATSVWTTGEDGGDATVVAVVAEQVRGPADWLAAVGERDFGFAAWPAGEEDGQ